VAHDLGADLHQSVAQRGYRPLLDLIGQRQAAQEAGQVIGQGAKLKPNRVGGKAVARQASPGDRVLALLDPLLRRAALVVEGNDARGGPCHVGHNKPDAGI